MNPKPAKPLASTLTASQVRRLLAAANIGLPVNGRGREWEIETKGDADKRKVCRVIQIGGYRCGHGGWVLLPGYTVNPYAGMGKADPMHY